MEARVNKGVQFSGFRVNWCNNCGLICCEDFDYYFKPMRTKGIDLIGSQVWLPPVFSLINPFHLFEPSINGEVGQIHLF